MIGWTGTNAPRLFLFPLFLLPPLPLPFKVRGARKGRRKKNKGQKKKGGKGALSITRGSGGESKEREKVCRRRPRIHTHWQSKHTHGERREEKKRLTSAREIIIEERSMPCQSMGALLLIHCLAVIFFGGRGGGLLDDPNRQQFGSCARR